MISLALMWTSCLLLLASAAPQHYVYLSQPPSQHYAQYNPSSFHHSYPQASFHSAPQQSYSAVPQQSYNTVPQQIYGAVPQQSYSSVPQQQQQQQQTYPAVSYNPMYTPIPQYIPQHTQHFNPQAQVPYNPSTQGYTPQVTYHPSNFNPGAVNFNPTSASPQYPPHQFFYNGSPNRQPQFVFVYPSGSVPQPHPQPGSYPQHPGVVNHVPVAPPRPPPIDETGDSETVTIINNNAFDSSAEREPLIPNPDSGKKGLPEKHTVPSMLTKAAVQQRPASAILRTNVPKPAPSVRVQQQRPVVTKEAAVEEPKEIPKDVLQSRMGSSADAETRAEAEEEGHALRAESRGWRRRLAPGLQSVYLDVEDDDDDDKKPAKEESGDSVVVGSSDAGPSGPSVASVKPAAIALAGPGGVASASPVGTAVVGPGGLAVAAPSATAVAGSGGVPPGALGGGASARSNMRLHQILEALYGAPARRAVLRTAPSAIAVDADYAE